MSDTNSERIRRAMELFRSVVRLDAADRAAFLDERCGGDAELRAEVANLLRHDDGSSENADILVGAGAEALAEAFRTTLAATPGGSQKEPGPPRRQLGRYRVLRRIGSGGMATVYEGEQDHPKRRVALKVIAPGLLTPKFRERFELESQVLARLQHPGIAQIFDAGTDQGEHGDTPFIVMELIDGKTLNHFMRATSLDTKSRLKLFLDICAAVEHAHRNGVIHRDLKPGNILVDESGQPKVLDFGIARLTDDPEATRKTTAGQFLGTLPYMSPEQVSGDQAAVDIRSDVYALGVILFELLCDCLPIDVSSSSVPEAARVITESEPPRLGRMSRTYRGDLETIVAKTLEKRPDRRYATVSELATDIERFLSKQPILARAPTTSYQLRKMVARHKLPFAFAATTVMLITGFAVWMTVLYARTATAERLAASEAATAQRTTTFLVDLFKGAQPREQRSRSVTVVEALERGAERLETELKDEPAVRSQLLNAIGMVYTDLGYYKKARAILDESLSDAHQVPEDGADANKADVLSSRGILQGDLGNFAAAERLHREAVEIRLRARPGDRIALANEMNSLGAALVQLDRIQEARDVLEDALDMRRAVLGEVHSETAESLHNLAMVIRRDGQLAEAQRLLRRALEVQQSVLSEDHPDLILTHYNLGELYRDLGNREASRRYYEQSLKLARRVYPADHPELAVALDGVAKAWYDAGDYAGAAGLFRETMEISGRHFGEAHPRGIAAQYNLATAQMMLGDLGAARRNFQECAEACREFYGPDHPQTGVALVGHSVVLRQLGRLEEAMQAAIESQRIKRSAYASDHLSLAMSIHTLAEVQCARGELDECEALCDEALAMRRRLFGEQHREVGQSLMLSARLQLVRGHPETAVLQYQEALGILEATLGARHPDVAALLYEMGEALLRAGDAVHAEAKLRSAVEIGSEAFAPDHWKIALTNSSLGEILMKQGRNGEAEPLLRRAHERLAEVLGPDHEEVRRARERLNALREKTGP